VASEAKDRKEIEEGRDPIRRMDVFSHERKTHNLKVSWAKCGVSKREWGHKGRHPGICKGNMQKRSDAQI